MTRAGRPQGPVRGATEAANELARFFREVTDGLTVRQLAERYGGGRTLWSEYRSGLRVIPLGRLNATVRDRVRDVRGQEAMLARARRLYETALAAESEQLPELRMEDALRQAEADMAEASRLVHTLLAIIAGMRGPFLSARTPLAGGPPPTAAAGRPAGIAPDTAAGSDTGTSAEAPAGYGVGLGSGGGAGARAVAGGAGAAGAEIRADGPPAPLDDAFDQLGSAWTVHEAARRTRAQARTGAERQGGQAPAGPELALALVRLAYALAYQSEELGRIRAAGPAASAGEPAVLEGVLLERMDRPGAADPRLAAAALPPGGARPYGSTGPAALGPAALGPAVHTVPGPGSVARERRLVNTVLVLAAVLCTVAVTTAAGIVIGRGQAREVRVIAAPVEVPGHVHAAPPPPAAPATTAAATPAATPSNGPSAPGLATPPALPSQRPTVTAAPPQSLAPPAPVTPSPGITRTAAPEPPPLPDGLIRLTVIGSRMCLAGPVGETNSALGQVQTGCGPGSEQFWQLKPEGAGPAGIAYSIHNRFTGQCLSVDAARIENDVVVTQYPCGDGGAPFEDQYWMFRYQPQYLAWQLVNRKSGKCVALRPGSGNLEQALQQECAADPWMLWRT